MKQNNALVSILIPVYNRRDMAIEAIECALEQDYETIEIIVGDNCSTDGTYEQLKEKYKKNSKVVLFRNDYNLGPVGNWEQCLSKAKGTYIKILWSDDLMTPDYISKAVKMLNDNPSAAFAMSTVKIFSNISELGPNRINNLQIHYKLKNKSGVYKGCEFLNASFGCPGKTPVSPGCAIFRKDKLRIIGNIPNNMGYVHKKNGAGPDVLMFLEALASGEKFIFINEPLSFFRGHADSISTFDKTIMDGYLSARLYYLKHHKIEKYWKDLNCAIISCTNRKAIFSKKKNRIALLKFYPVANEIIDEPSIIDVLKFKIINKINS